jgi:hypothetical protein
MEQYSWSAWLSAQEQAVTEQYSQEPTTERRTSSVSGSISNSSRLINPDFFFK